MIWYRIANKTEIVKDAKPAELTAFAPGDAVSVDSNASDDGIYTAVTVAWRGAGSPADRAAAGRTEDLPKLPGSQKSEDERPVLRREANAATQEEAPAPPSTIVRPPDAQPDADDPGRPVLRRRNPEEVEVARTQAAAAQPEEPPKAAQVQIEAAPPDAILEKAREAAAAYAASLPNFFARQVTTRYQKQTGEKTWQALDVVTADLAYEDGRESYKNIKIGSKTVNKSMEEIGGATSTGEFATLLEDVFHPATDAQFRKSGSSAIHNRTATLYHFEIPRERSHFRVSAPSELYYPAMKGSLWIDQETGRVLRLEVQARGLPKLFPFDAVETALDYGFVRLSDLGSYLLPTESDALMCTRGTPYCSRNNIEFRNYRKFGSQSDVRFEDEP